MKPTEAQSFKKIFVVLNPVAGNSSVEDIRKMLETHFQKGGRTYEIYETTGEENISEVTQNACRQGADLVIAAGGDGTVSSVVNGLIHTGVPLGIIPVGTGNGLARAMGLPLNPEEAVRLLAGENVLQPLDAMQVGDRFYVLNVSAGISSRAMKKTSSEDKRRLGILAYFQTIFKDLNRHRPQRFQLELDNHAIEVQAVEILVANGTVLKETPYLFGSREYYHDGKFEVNILSAEGTADYVRLAWEMLIDPQEATAVRDLTVKNRIRLDVRGRPQPVQADGEIIGRTPVEIELVPDALQVVAPVEKDADPD